MRKFFDTYFPKMLIFNISFFGSPNKSKNAL